jgi:class 3 adenylate cyclase
VPAALKTANLSIVFTDIKGFTERTSSQTLEENQRLLRTHDQLMTPLFKAFGGKIIKKIGDAFLVTFESPTQSVLCGLAIQDRLWLYNRTVQLNERFEVRVAINAGEVRVEAGDVFGEPVNIAARVEGIAEAGSVFFTEAVYLAMNKAEVPSEEVGLFELKGIPGKVKVFKVPRGPYRVEAPTEPNAPVSTDDAMPPYGNIGLSKVSDDPTLKALDAAAGVATAAAALGSKAVAFGGEVLGKTSDALSKAGPRRFPVSPKMLGGVGVAIILLILFALFSGGGMEGALKDVKRASGRDRDQKTQLARKRIDALKDPAERTYYYGALEEAQGKYGSAARFYAEAASTGDKRGTNALIEMLEHPTCSVRSAAANAIGDEKIVKAKAALEDLAEDGGPDDSGNTGLLSLVSCNSKEAASRALKELERSE